MDEKIQFFSEGVSFKFKQKARTRKWLLNVIEEEGKIPWYINYIFCTDEYLLDLNRSYLKRESLTDVIAFSFAEDKLTISGDIYISLVRVRENATKYRQEFENELNRVMIHGLLHLIGYEDTSPAGKRIMTSKEDHHLRIVFH